MHLCVCILASGVVREGVPYKVTLEWRSETGEEVRYADVFSDMSREDCLRQR